MAIGTPHSRALSLEPYSRGLAALGASLLLLLLAGCGGGLSAPRGPYASPQPTSNAAVAQRLCGDPTRTRPPRSGTPVAVDDIEYVRVALIRQGTQLQRVADDLSGAVPGGDPPADTRLALNNMAELRARLEQSPLCAPLKARLLPLVTSLLEADRDLVAAADAGQAIDPALARARAAYAALQSALPA